MDILKILNFLKWQIEARLPKGSITQRVYNGIMYDGYISPDDPFYYIYWLDLNRDNVVKYLLGTFGTTNEDYQVFIDYLNRNYKKGDFYEIRDFGHTYTVPVPKEKDYKCFKAEFLDIIMPQLVKYRKLYQPFLEGPYEYGGVSIKEGSNVLDLGANYGLFSSLASGKGANVYAFEPTPRVYEEYLKPLDKMVPTIHAIDMAISVKSGSVLFAVDDELTSCNHIKRNANDYRESIVVRSTSVDDFMDFMHLDGLDFIKADIECSEDLMLKGARQTLKEFEPDLAICAYHKFNDAKVLTDLILDANPNYEVVRGYKKIYARSRRKR